MKVLYDYQIFSFQKYGGISRYFCELMDQFSMVPDISINLAIRYSHNENLLARSSLDKYWSNKNPFYSNWLFHSIKKPFYFDVLTRIQINKSESVRLLRKSEFDIFHPTYYDPYFLKHIGNKPYVLTVYDMIYELFPDFFSFRDPTIKRKKQLIESASSVIAISQNTKNDIIRYTDIDPDCISVIYLGPSLNPTNPIRHQEKNSVSSDLNEYYLLFVGKRSGYKNFCFMISSISVLLKKNKFLHLYCAGGGPFTSVEIQFLKDLDIYSKVHFIFISSDDILIRLYKNACAFIFPSLYEGFGLPILEAFSCGCPVVVSNSSSLSEIAGDAACYFNPGNADSIAEAVVSIVLNPEFRDDLIKKGYERLKCFSWEKTAKETKCVYDNILNQ